MASHGQRIAINTILLYFRSIITLLLAIYTSRVLLQVLGVDNYGIYNIVGGIVALFLSIKSIFASSVQRFLNFEKGKGNDEGVSRIFSTSVIIHFVVALIFVLIVEIFGLLYIPNKMNLPDGMLSTAMFVFHCSVITTAFTIITIPHDAVIIANEKMNFYAWMSIADHVLKLLIIFIIPLLPFHYLRTYAVLILLVSLVIRIATIYYTKRFPECNNLKYNNIRNETTKELSKFAGWNFLGCCASSLIEEGSNMIINIFGGVVANAARGISYQIKNAITSLSGNIVIASQPFIVQNAASSEKFNTWNFLFLQAKVVFIMISIIALPIYVYVNDILKLWLVDVPPQALEFTRAVLIYVVVMSFQKSLDLAFKTYNKLPLYQIIDSIILLTSLPLIYFALSSGWPLYSSFLILSATRIIDYIAIVIIAKHQLGLNINDLCHKVLYPVTCSIIIFIIVGIVFSRYLVPSNSIVMIFYVIMMIIVMMLLLFFVVLSKSEKEKVNGVLNKTLKRN